MDDRGAGATTDSILVSEAYATARELLVQAEADAARIRGEADRYKRQREQEAELLVAKARRLLLMAEERAATIRPATIDLDAPTVPAEPERVETALDSILANAVSNAIHRALPSDR